MKKIVKLLFIVSLLIVGSCNQSTKKNTSTVFADVIYFGGDILTMEGDTANFAEAVAIKDGKIPPQWREFVSI